MIGRGSTLSERVSQGLIAAADKAGIEYTVEGSGRYTGTDADAIQMSRAGIAAGLVSIPLRYMHSTVEMCQLSDVEAAIELIVAYAATIAVDDDFRRQA